jgi:ATP/maltotriose-dependent transcriptional regulator MalT
LLAESDRVWERTSERYLVIVLDALRGWLDVCEGSTSGLDTIVESVARSRSEGETLHLTYTLLLLARARGIVGELHEGRAATREALSWTRRTNQRYLEAELLRVDGELAYRSGDADVAAAAMREAVAVASAQGADWLHRKAAQTLANRFQG